MKAITFVVILLSLVVILISGSMWMFVQDFREIRRRVLMLEADRKDELNRSEIPNNCEPQTDCGDFADRLAYERGIKHAWEVAQKVFNSTVTFYEAEDVAKQIAKDEPQTEREGE